MILLESSTDLYTPLGWTMFVIIALPAIGYIIYLFYKVFRLIILEEFLKVKPFTPEFKAVSENLQYAFLVLGWHMMISEIDKLHPQGNYLFRYLRRLYPNTPTTAYQSMLKLHRYHPDPSKVIEWFKYSIEKEKHIEVVDFLIDLAFYNELIHPKERSLIYLAADILDITPSQLKSLLEIRYRKKEEREKRSARPARNNISKKRSALTVLGIEDEGADFETIKKAYRSQAKQHHPDVYTGASKAEKKLAGERFIVINQAYEHLEKLFND